jgi:hypothetical protein
MDSKSILGSDLAGRHDMTEVERSTVPRNWEERFLKCIIRVSVAIESG